MRPPDRSDLEFDPWLSIRRCESDRIGRSFGVPTGARSREASTHNIITEHISWQCVVRCVRRQESVLGRARATIEFIIGSRATIAHFAILWNCLSMSAFSRCINYIITVLVASTNRNLFSSFVRNSHTLSDRVEVRQPHPEVNRMNT